LQTLVSLLETCGRFLFLTPETHERTVASLELLKRLKAAKVSYGHPVVICFCLDPLLLQGGDAFVKDLVESAVFAVIPPERAVVPKASPWGVSEGFHVVNIIPFLIIDCAEGPLGGPRVHSPRGAGVTQ
jgi:hypothetical protein